MINTLALIFTTLVAVEHLYIACVEMFMWDTMGKRIFKKTMRPELFSETKELAANLGLYNGATSSRANYWTMPHRGRY